MKMKFEVPKTKDIIIDSGLTAYRDEEGNLFISADDHPLEVVARPPEGLRAKISR